MPDDLLGPLDDGPLPPLAPAAAVRARGDQRRRRTAAALAGGAALSLVLGAGAASLLLGGDERDALQAAPQPSSSSSPASSPSPSPEPSAVPTPSPSPRATAAPPSRSPSPQPTRAAVPASELLLTVEDAQRAEPGDWRREGQDVEGPLLDPCTGGTDYPRDADVVDSAATELISRREAGGTSAVQTVARYTSAAAARDAADGYERAVRGCPTEVEDDDELVVQRSHQVVEEWSEVGGVRTLYVRSESTCASCSTGYQYYAVQVAADAVSVIVVGHGEDGDPGDDVVRPFAREAAANLS